MKKECKNGRGRYNDPMQWLTMWFLLDKEPVSIEQKNVVNQFALFNLALESLVWTVIGGNLVVQYLVCTNRALTV